MSKEEAIKQLEAFRTCMIVYDAEPYVVEALNMAVESLEQEPCEDAISRQAVLNLIEHYNSDGLGSVFYGYEQGVKFADAVNKLPPVAQKSETITEFADRCRECGKRYVKRQTGHWIHFASGDDCSECGWSTGRYISPSKYCPGCGCLMVEPKESEVRDADSD